MQRVNECRRTRLREQYELLVLAALMPNCVAEGGVCSRAAEPFIREDRGLVCKVTALRWKIAGSAPHAAAATWGPTAVGSFR